MSHQTISRKRVATSTPMQDGLKNWYRMHDFEVTEVRSESQIERLTPSQAKGLLDIRDVHDDIGEGS